MRVKVLLQESIVGIKSCTSILSELLHLGQKKTSSPGIDRIVVTDWIMDFASICQQFLVSVYDKKKKDEICIGIFSSTMVEPNLLVALIWMNATWTICWLMVIFVLHVLKHFPKQEQNEALHLRIATISGFGRYIYYKEKVWWWHLSLPRCRLEQFNFGQGRILQETPWPISFQLDPNKEFLSESGLA